MTDATQKISIRGLSKAFGSKVVLDNLDLDVPGVGESVLIIGGSGHRKIGLAQMHPRAAAA